MIKINLALRKQSAAVADSGDSSLASASKGAFKFDARLDGLRELPDPQIIVFVGAAFALNYFVEDHKQQLMAEADVKLEALEAEKGKLLQDVAKTKDYLPMKAQLEADEQMIRTKINTVRSLIADRQTPPKLFASLSGATPKEIWLDEVKIELDKVTLKGRAQHVTDIPDFMKSIGESAFFTDILLEDTRTGRDPAQAQVADFILAAKRRREEVEQ